MWEIFKIRRRWKQKQIIIFKSVILYRHKKIIEKLYMLAFNFNFSSHWVQKIEPVWTFSSNFYCELNNSNSISWVASYAINRYIGLIPKSLIIWLIVNDYNWSEFPYFVKYRLAYDYYASLRIVQFVVIPIPYRKPPYFLTWNAIHFDCWAFYLLCNE